MPVLLYNSFVGIWHQPRKYKICSNTHWFIMLKNCYRPCPLGRVPWAVSPGPCPPGRVPWVEFSTSLILQTVLQMISFHEIYQYQIYLLTSSNPNESASIAPYILSWITWIFPIFAGRLPSDFSLILNPGLRLYNTNKVSRTQNKIHKTPRKQVVKQHLNFSSLDAWNNFL